MPTDEVELLRTQISELHRVIGQRDWEVTRLKAELYDLHARLGDGNDRPPSKEGSRRSASPAKKKMTKKSPKNPTKSGRLEGLLTPRPAPDVQETPTTAGVLAEAATADTPPAAQQQEQVGTHIAGGDFRIARAPLGQFVSACLEAAGATSANARLVADVLIYADCRGIPSHGCNRADFYAEEVQLGLVDGRAVPEVVKDAGCCAVIDGKNGLGAVTAKVATDLAITKASEHGVGWVVCRQSNHFGAAGYWSQLASDAGMVGFAFTNTAPYMVPTGGQSRAVGTNPLCCFAPGSISTFQLDMATTTVPVNAAARAHRMTPALYTARLAMWLRTLCMHGTRTVL
jgi:hypothetical protein